MRIKITLSIGLSLLSAAVRPAIAAPPPPLDDFLKRGELKEALAAHAEPRNDAERFSLAAAQVMEGARAFSAGFNALSVNPTMGNMPLPFLRVIVPAAPSGPPKVATPAAVAELFRNFKTALLQANATLSAVEGREEFGVRLNLTEAALDFSGDGTITRETETLQRAFARVLGGFRGGAGDAPLVVQFDQADAAWLKGYTYFLAGVIDLLAAYDWLPVWNQSAHILFMKPEPRPAIAAVQVQPLAFGQWPDLIAAVHDMRLDLVDPEGPRRFRDNFLLMIEQSRICWRRALEETDDVDEWLPNPDQTGPGGAKITREQIDGWLRVLEELESVGRGQKLLPHWRMKSGTGINVARLIEAAPKLDLVLWIQGSAFLPFAQEGTISDAATWRELRQPFGPGFVQFALWSN